MPEGYLLTLPPDPLFCGNKHVSGGAYTILVSSAPDQVGLEDKLSVEPEMFEH